MSGKKKAIKPPFRMMVRVLLFNKKVSIEQLIVAYDNFYK